MNPIRFLSDPLKCWTFKKGIAALLRQEVFSNSCFFRHPVPDLDILTGAFDYGQNGVLLSYIYRTPKLLRFFPIQVNWGEMKTFSIHFCISTDPGCHSFKKL